MAERKMIIIDAGHGGSEPGAIYNGRREEDDNLRLALAVGRLLAEKGFDVRYTRTDDTYQTPLEKAMIANRAGGDYFVSLHRNAMPIPGSGSGVESLVFENSGVAGEMAQAIDENLSRLGFQNLGVKERPGLVVLRRTQMPAVLVEAGFIDNEEDNQKFDREFNRIAAAIADGVAQTIVRQEEREPEYYQVQTGAYRMRSLAQQQVDTLRSQGFPAFMVYEDGYYKVRAGAFRNLDYAAAQEKELRNLGYNTILVRRKAVT